MLTHPKEITSGWESHFLKLYSFCKNVAFDNNCKKYVDDELNSIIQHTVVGVCSDDRVTTAMTERALKTYKKRKACGFDKFYYENMLYGGQLLIKCIIKLFNCMLKFSYTPAELKRGVITVLYKGAQKCKSDPTIYRAISLCSALFKLYEKVILVPYIAADEGHFIVNSSQGGFQKSVSCQITSFLLREHIYHTAVNN